jgi:integrase/recombinase XerD
MGRRGEHRPQHVPGDPADPAGWPCLVDEFCEHMGAKGFSPRTLANRRGGMVALVAWLAERGVTRPGEVTRAMVERYQRALFHYRKPDGAPLSFRAQSQRLVSVQAFFRWATRAGYLPANPASEIELPKSELRLPKPAFSVAEAEAVLAQPDIAEPLGLRDRAMLEVLYSTGVFSRGPAVRGMASGHVCAGRTRPVLGRRAQQVWCAPGRKLTYRGWER